MMRRGLTLAGNGGREQGGRMRGSAKRVPANARRWAVTVLPCRTKVEKERCDE